MHNLPSRALPSSVAAVLVDISALTSQSFDTSNLFPSKIPVDLLVSIMHFGAWAAALCACRGVLADMNFVNPPSHRTGQGALSLNSVYSQQTVLTIQWTGAKEGIISTIVLWQVNLTALGEVKAGDPQPTLGELEYITSQSLLFSSHGGHWEMNRSLTCFATGGVHWNMTSFPWSVTTRKDLKVSNMFVMSLYKTGEAGFDDESVLFNISSPTTAPSATSTLITDTNPYTASASASLSPPSSSEGTSHGGLDTAATVGIGIGIPVAAIAGIAAGWLISRKKNNNAGQGSAPEPVREDYKSRSTLPASMHESGGQERSSTGPHELYASQLSQDIR